MNKQFVSETLGFNVEAISKEAMSVWKLVFEQVLLLAIHSRQLYIDKDRKIDNQNYHQRIKLINILDKLSQKKSLGEIYQSDMQRKFVEILEMINANSGTNDIVKYLQDEDGEEIEHRPTQISINNKLKILNELEQQLVVFRKWDGDNEFVKNKFYSYYSLFKILKDPIVIFQSLLSLPIPNEEYIANQIIESISIMIRDNLNQFRDLFTSDDAVETLLNSAQDPHGFVLKNLKTLGLEDESKKKAFVEKFTLSVKNDLAKYMSAWADYIFNQLTKPFFKANEHPFYLFKQDNSMAYDDLEPVSFFQEICEISVVDDKISINIDKNGFADILSINQLSALSEQISLGLKNIDFSKPSQVKFSLENKVELLDAFKMLAKWYEFNKTKLIQNPTQLPKLMVMVLDFDATHDIGLFSKDLNEINYNAYYKQNRRMTSISGKERHNIITLLVSACLYYHEESDVSTIIINNKKSPEVYSKSKSDLDNLSNLLDNHFMIDWTIFEKPQDMMPTIDDTNKNLTPDINLGKQKIDQSKKSSNLSGADKRQKQIIDRFKKMLDYLHRSKNKEFDMVSILIKEQKTLKKKSPIYPLNSGFPLPLWVNESKHIVI